MMLKRWLFIVVFGCCGSMLMAQDDPLRPDEEDGKPGKGSWSVSSGSMIYLFRQYFNGVPFNGTNSLGVFGARYNFKYLGKSTALSVGSYPGAGVAFFSGFGTNNVYFSFDLPLVLELHTGADAHPYVDGRDVFGFFVGAGMGLNFLNRDFYLNNPKSGLSYGPMTNTGIKLNLNGRPIILRGSYLLNFNPDLPDLKAIGLLWSLGGR